MSVCISVCVRARMRERKREMADVTAGQVFLRVHWFSFGLEGLMNEARWGDRVNRESAAVWWTIGGWWIDRNPPAPPTSVVVVVPTAWFVGGHCALSWRRFWYLILDIVPARNSNIQNLCKNNKGLRYQANFLGLSIFAQNADITLQKSSPLICVDQGWFFQTFTLRTNPPSNQDGCAEWTSFLPQRQQQRLHQITLGTDMRKKLQKWQTTFGKVSAIGWSLR